MNPSLHLISLPHTSTTSEFVSCAYTMRNLKFANMMSTIDYDVYLYGGPENEANCKEHIVIASKEEQNRWFGEYEFHSNFFPITWSPSDPHWVESNNNAINELRKRIQPKDLILVSAGICQKQIADAFPNHIVVEYGIGYTGVFSKFKVFESYAHMHWVYGRVGTDDGHFYDSVIPNYFVPEDFRKPEYPLLDLPDEYYVWMGRFIKRKGPEIAVEATRRLGVPLIMAGQGVRSEVINGGETTLLGYDGTTVSGEHIRHIGHVDVSQRAELLGGAIATFMPTTYLEPFGGVSIESMMCGTPVIASDFGVFSETVPHGLAGFRARTMGEFTQFASDEYLSKLDRGRVQQYAEENFSVDVIKYRYDDYFKQLSTLWGDGFYTEDTTSARRYSKWPTS